MIKALCEVELVQAQTEDRKPKIVEFFIIQYTKCRTLELYYNFSTNFCDEDKLEELETDTASLYLAFAEKEREDCLIHQMKAEWEQLWSENCTKSFTADVVGNFFPRKCCHMHQKLDK